MFVVVPQSMRVSSDELGNVYRWILQHRALHAYPFLQTDFLLGAGACKKINPHTSAIESLPNHS